MEFGWINLFGAVIVVIMLIPNVIFAVKEKGTENKCKDVFMNCVEQIGRYACIILMWLPLLVWKFGFHSVAEMMLYLICNGILLLAYLICWAIYLKRPSGSLAMCLAILPTAIFLISGLLLRHWLLFFAAVLFGSGHIYVTKQNNQYYFSGGE